MGDILPEDASPEVKFFFENAGYRVGTRYEDAVELANAEAWVRTQRHTFKWTPADSEWDGDEPLPEGCIYEDCLLTIRFKACPCCGSSGKHTESLGSIAYMPGSAYRRVVEAELASQAMSACKDSA